MPDTQFVYIWEYEVLPEYKEPFELLYGPDGKWVKLFRKHPGFISTRLLVNIDKPLSYITIDSWNSKESFNEFRKTFKREFDELDKEGSTCTLSEKAAGEYILYS